MPIIPEYSFAEGRHAPSTASPEMAGLPGRANAKYIAPAIMDVGKAAVGIAASYLKSEEARADLEVAGPGRRGEKAARERICEQSV